MQSSLIFIAFACLLLLMYAAQRYARKQKELNVPHIATVLSIVQTSRREGDLQEVDVQIEIAGRTPRRAMVRQWMNPKHLPRPGQIVRVIKQRGALVFAGFTDEMSVPTAPQASQVTAQQDPSLCAVIATELTPELRTQGRLGIATVIGARTNGTGSTRFILQIDSINQQRPRTVELDQALPPDTFSAGERAYLLVDSQDSTKIRLLAPAQVGGQRLPREMNRLDPYVLGPELLRNGVRARGTVLASTQVPLGPEHEVRGFTRFRLTFRIEPEITALPPYQAEQIITLTRPDKIAAMATPGAVVPLRIDAAHPDTFTMDSIAMGYGDPYAEVLNLFREQLSTTGAAR
jgi:hypothetical protein